MTKTTDHNGDGVPRLALGEQEAAVAIGISRRSLWTLRRAGLIPHARIGGRVVYLIDDLRAWLVAQRVTPAAQKNSPAASGDEQD